MEFLLAAVAEGSSAKHIRRSRVQDAEPHACALDDSGRVEDGTIDCHGCVATSVPPARDVTPQTVDALVTKIRTACEEAVRDSLEDEVILPREAILQLAHLVWEVKTASWKTGVDGIPDGFQALGRLDGVLSDVFEATAQLDVESEINATKVTSSSRKTKQKAVGSQCSNADGSSALLRLSNIEASLVLAAMYFDTLAFLGSPLAIFSDRVGDSVQRFLSHHTRATLPSACSQQEAKPKKQSFLGASAPRLANAIARVLRSMHHVLAASHYASTPMAHRVSPLALHSLVAATRIAPVLIRPLHSAATDVLISVIGQADEELQASAVEELSKAFLTADIASSKGSDQHGPQALTAAVLHALSASATPCRTGTVSGSDLLAAVEHKYAVVESRAGTFVARILQHTLLASERESDAWALLQHICTSLLAVSADLLWPSAPMLLLAFVKGLTRIASVARSVDIVWTQREFAVKLLGQIAKVLCQQSVQVADPSRYKLTDAEFTAIQRWLPWFGTSVQALDLKRDVDATRQVLIAFLDQTPTSSSALLHPVSHSMEAAAVPADHPLFSSSFLLCSWAVQAQGSRRQSSVKGKRGRAKAVDKKKNNETLTSTTEFKPCWPLSMWLARTSTNPEDQVNQKTFESGDRDAIARCIQKMYRHMVLGSEDTLLVHARKLTLETLLTLMKGAPLVHVRKQAVVGLSAACAADLNLLGSKCVAEAVALSLQDDSALVRFAGVDFIANLDANSSKSAVITELRKAVYSKLSDASPVVRRAAFRVACSSLNMNDPVVAEKIADILRRISHETAQIRTFVLGALEHVLFKFSSINCITSTLQTLLMLPGVGGNGLRDLLKTHRSASDEQGFATSMEHLVNRSLSLLDEAPASHDPTPQVFLLEQISAECPSAMHAHTSRLLSWLVRSEGGALLPVHRATLSRHSCKILSNVLPSLHGGTHVCPVGIEAMGQKLRQTLSSLLTSPDVALVRAATECFCVVAMHVGGSLEALLGHFNSAILYLRMIIEERRELDGPGREEACRSATIMGTTLEFLKLDVLLAESGNIDDTDIDLTDLAVAAALLLSELCLNGPPALRPALVPCLGFLLRRYSSLLCTQVSTFEVFNDGLASTYHNTALQANALEAVALLLTSFEQSASGALATPGQLSTGPSISEAVQRVGCLQTQVLEVLRAAEAPNVAGHAVGALQSMHRLGVLHPSSMLPGLLAASLVACMPVARLARQLMMQILERNPDLLASRFGAGVREAVSLIAKRIANDFKPGSLSCERRRFEVLREAYAEHLEGRQPREQFLEAVLAEITGLACAGEMDDALRLSSTETFCLFEFLFGILMSLPLRNEFELAHVLRNTSKFLTLRTMPLLPDGGGPTPTASAALGISVSSILLHNLCMHWAEEQDIKRMLAVVHCDGSLDQPLPVQFVRRAAPDLSTPLQELAAVVGNVPELLSVLAKYVLPDSCLLQGPGTYEGGKRIPRRGRKRGATSLLPSHLGA